LKKKKLAIALVLIVAFLVPFFSYFANVANNEKTAMESLSFAVTSASIDSITTDMINYYIAGSITISIRLINPSAYDTPTFSVNFAWYLTIPSSLDEEREYCGTEKITPMNIPSGNHSDSTFTLAFDLRRASPALINAIQARQVVMILGGSLQASIFFGLIPARKSFLENIYVSS
jgi:hypothetical protein